MPSECGNLISPNSEMFVSPMAGLSPRPALQAGCLPGADGHAVDEKRGGRIMIMGGDPEDLHGSVLAGRRLGAIGDRRPARTLTSFGAFGEPCEGRQQNEILNREDEGAQQ